MNNSGIVPTFTTDLIPSHLRATMEPSVKNEFFIGSIKRIEQMLGKQRSAPDSLKNLNPSLLLLAGTRMTYANHLASQAQYDEAIEQVEKAQGIYDRIDFSQVANQSHSKSAFLDNCTQLMKKCQLGK